MRVLISPISPRALYVLLAGVLALGVLVTGSSSRAQSETNRAGLVVQFGDGSIQTFCVNFEQPGISGLDLLNAAGLNTIYDATSSGFGAGVCKINNDGCNFPAQDCFCQCQGLQCVYWSYWHLGTNNAWTYSELGASGYTLQPGQVDGWRWGAGTTGNTEPPPVRTFSEVCLPATATATPTNTASPTATRSPTPLPTATPVPVQITFTAAPTTLAAGQCATVSWKVSGPWTAIYFQGAIVTPEEQQPVCPNQTETLTLRVDYNGTVDTRTLTLTVSGTAAPTAATTPTTVEPTPAATLPPATPPVEATAMATVTTPADGGSTATPAVSPTPLSTAAPPPAPRQTSTPTATQAMVAVTGTPEVVAAAPGTSRVNPVRPVSERGAPAGQGATPWLQYLAFAVILAVVGGLAVFVLWRLSNE